LWARSRGIGLGLSVVKPFVEMHGGTVSVDTSQQGTRVTVKLPAGQINPE
jgi:signal transduction histidine kinase